MEEPIYRLNASRTELHPDAPSPDAPAVVSAAGSRYWLNTRPEYWPRDRDEFALSEIRFAPILLLGDGTVEEFTAWHVNHIF